MSKTKKGDPNVQRAAAELWDLAQSGTKLSADERRAVIAYLDERDGQAVPAADLAAVFNVTDAVVREDRRSILREYGAQITPEYALSFVASFLRNHDMMIKKVKEGIAACPAGTRGHQEYVRLLSDLESKKMKMLQEVGAVPKELGRMQVVEERWEAVVAEDGVASVKQAPVTIN